MFVCATNHIISPTTTILQPFPGQLLQEEIKADI